MKVKIYTYQLTILLFMRTLIIMTIGVIFFRIVFFADINDWQLTFPLLDSDFLFDIAPFVIFYSIAHSLGNRKLRMVVKEIEGKEKFVSWLIEYFQKHDHQVIKKTEKELIATESEPEIKKRFSFLKKRKKYYKIKLKDRDAIITGPLKDINKSLKKALSERVPVANI
jgi:hypothetical protein